MLRFDFDAGAVLEVDDVKHPVAIDNHTVGRAEGVGLARDRRNRQADLNGAIESAPGGQFSHVGHILAHVRFHAVVRQLDGRALCGFGAV